MHNILLERTDVHYILLGGHLYVKHALDAGAFHTILAKFIGAHLKRFFRRVLWVIGITHDA